MSTPQSYTDVLTALGVSAVQLPEDLFNEAMAAASPAALEAKATDFGNAYQALQSMTIDQTQHPDMYTLQQQLLSSAEVIAPIVQWATAVFDDVATWFSNASSTVADWAQAATSAVSNTYESAVDWTSDELSSLFGPDVSQYTTAPATPAQGLGLLQLIPVAIIAGCIAMMAYWLTQYATFQQQVKVYQAALDKGATPQQAAAAAQALAPQGLTSGIKAVGSSILWPLVILGGVFLAVKYGPQIQRALERRSSHAEA